MAGTLGTLFVDGVWQCWTLEDVDREPTSDGRSVTLTSSVSSPDRAAWVATWKLPRITAVPIGTYPLELTYSPKFQRQVPLVADVPGFTGIRFHPGNTPGDTDGCILPGQGRGADRVTLSQAAYDRLLQRLKPEWARGVTITIARALEIR